MARPSRGGWRTSRRGRMKWLQIVIWTLTLLVAISMVLALLPIGR
jgi:hypothetical protein